MTVSAYLPTELASVRVRHLIDIAADSENPSDQVAHDVMDRLTYDLVDAGNETCVVLRDDEPLSLRRFVEHFGQDTPVTRTAASLITAGVAGGGTLNLQPSDRLNGHVDPQLLAYARENS